ncbi:MAG: serine/threonine protein kinase, partial [Myxococcales bacterium]|nr:serine/threonine protein kinase [Myxococcales bacterium]
MHGVRRADLDATPRSKRHLLGVTIGDAYTVNGYLGSGAFGAVYRAEQKALGRDVALKLLMVDTVHDPVIIRRFQREARTAAALLDPNIVTLFDYGEAALSEDAEDRVLWIAMELITGRTLKSFLEDGRGIGLEAAVLTGLNILRGLSSAHQLGVVHRDLKPGNVLIDESRRQPWFARLFDFGIASLQGSGGHTTQMGQGGVLGTPKYMAPEQWRAQQTSPSTDIYAFGVIMAEMLLGRPPIPRMDLVKMGTAHCRGPRPQVTRTGRQERVPPPLTAFIQRCMAIDPANRYPSAADALAALEQIEILIFGGPTGRVTGGPGPLVNVSDEDSESRRVEPPINIFISGDSDAPAAVSGPPPPAEEDDAADTVQAPALLLPPLSPPRQAPRRPDFSDGVRIPPPFGSIDQSLSDSMPDALPPMAQVDTLPPESPPPPTIDPLPRRRLLTPPTEPTPASPVDPEPEVDASASTPDAPPIVAPPRPAPEPPAPLPPYAQPTPPIEPIAPTASDHRRAMLWGTLMAIALGIGLLFLARKPKPPHPVDEALAGQAAQPLPAVDAMASAAAVDAGRPPPP